MPSSHSLVSTLRLYIIFTRSVIIWGNATNCAIMTSWIYCRFYIVLFTFCCVYFEKEDKKKCEFQRQDNYERLVKILSYRVGGGNANSLGTHLKLVLYSAIGTYFSSFLKVFVQHHKYRSFLLLFIIFMKWIRQWSALLRIV